MEDILHTRKISKRDLGIYFVWFRCGTLKNAEFFQCSCRSQLDYKCTALQAVASRHGNNDIFHKKLSRQVTVRSPPDILALVLVKGGIPLALKPSDMPVGPTRLKPTANHVTTLLISADGDENYRKPFGTKQQTQKDPTWVYRRLGHNSFLPCRSVSQSCRIYGSEIGGWYWPQGRK